jgi:hypothetical protein
MSECSQLHSFQKDKQANISNSHNETEILFQNDQNQFEKANIFDLFDDFSPNFFHSFDDFFII